VQEVRQVQRVLYSPRILHSSTDKTLNACRAYFHVDLDGTANVRAIVLNFFDEQSGGAERGDGAESTGIVEITDPTPDPSP